MKTKEEILQEHEDKYDIFLETGSDCGIKPIYSAMEEYAKQEAKEVLNFYKKRQFNHTITWKMLTETWDEFYEKYQQSKINNNAN